MGELCNAGIANPMAATAKIAISSHCTRSGIFIRLTDWQGSARCALPLRQSCPKNASAPLSGAGVVSLLVGVSD
jgi:hypothetical protein